MSFAISKIPKNAQTFPSIRAKIAAMENLSRLRGQLLGGCSTAPGPSGDYDNDGRLELILPEYGGRCRLLHNERPGGRWLQVQVEGSQGLNRMGIGARRTICPAGKLGKAQALLGCREIATGYGYASGQPACTHFGLGQQEQVNVEWILPQGRGTISRREVRANQRITLKTGPSQ